MLGYAESPKILDAPVSGGVPAAEAGKLTFMVLFFASHHNL
jgi:3-hydroxyisobutyrate/3-hydroxypropionate dehydrogenase